jgi:superoxide oxidase
MSPQQRYSSLSIFLHWIMVALITAVYACMLLREYVPRGSDLREGLKTWHFMLGLLVLALIIVRIFARLVGRSSRRAPAPPPWQAWLAKTTHLALYAFMVAMPIAGWLILSASGKVIPWFGLELPALTGPSQALAGQVKEVHETVGTIGYFLIGFHALAALYHHYVARDDVLRRMMPRR